MKKRKSNHSSVLLSEPAPDGDPVEKEARRCPDRRWVPMVLLNLHGGGYCVLFTAATWEKIPLLIAWPLSMLVWASAVYAARETGKNAEGEPPAN